MTLPRFVAVRRPLRWLLKVVSQKGLVGGLKQVRENILPWRRNNFVDVLLTKNLTLLSPLLMVKAVLFQANLLEYHKIPNSPRYHHTRQNI